jgi:hypothetical protein
MAGRAGLALLLACLPALALGCYRPWSPRTFMMQRSVASRELYREPDFEREDLEREGVSILSARLSFGQETYGQPLMQGLVEAMQRRLPNAKLVHPNLMASRVNEAGLARAYAAMLATYDETGILDRELSRELAKAVGVGYFMVPILVSFQEQSATRLSVFSLRLIKTISATERVQLEIWGADSGRIVWEGISDLTLAQDTFRERLVRFEDTVRATWESLIGKIPSRPASESKVRE